MIIHICSFAHLPPQTRTVILIGGRSSDHLKEVARMLEFRGRAAYRVESETELQPQWLVGVNDVGILVGAENLQHVQRAVVERLKQFAAASALGMLEGVAQ